VLEHVCENCAGGAERAIKFKRTEFVIKGRHLAQGTPWEMRAVNLSLDELKKAVPKGLIAHMIKDSVKVAATSTANAVKAAVVD